MVRGFIFDGVDIDKIGLEYAPQMSQTFVHHSSTFKTHEESSDGHDGAYYYGETVQPKQFIIRCFFEDKFINSDLPMKIEAQFRRGRTGKLIFKERPWCYYVATVTKSVDFSDLKSYLNGIVTINMTAYYPFGRCDQYYIADNNDENNEALLMNTGMFIDNGEANQPGKVRAFTGVVNGQLHHQYNPGTEMADVAVHITGNVGTGQTIKNETTGQAMKVIGLTAANTSGKELIIDSLNGKSVMVNSATGAFVSNGYIYHDGGFIQFAPCTPMYKDLKGYRVSSYGQGSTLNPAYTIELDCEECYIDNKVADGTYCVVVKRNNQYEFLTISEVLNNGMRLVVKENASSLISTSSAGTDIVIARFNLITCEGTGFSNLNISFEFKPTFA